MPFVLDEVYHVFNRSVAHQPIFTQNRANQRFLDAINFYRFSNLQLKFSRFNQFSSVLKSEYLQKLESSHEKLVEILAFCLMPNHMHFLLRQVKDNGIPTFMKYLQNSYAKYVNTKTKRTGALFQNMFKGVRIESEEQLLHVARYIHLNPFTSFLLPTMIDLENYPWSSYGVYLEKRNYPFVKTDELRSVFKTTEKFREFMIDQSDYQRVLGQIKHLAFDNP